MIGRLLSKLFEELPPDARQEVRDFVEFLISKHGRSLGKKLHQGWFGSCGSIVTSTARWSCKSCLSSVVIGLSARHKYLAGASILWGKSRTGGRKFTRDEMSAR